MPFPPVEEIVLVGGGHAHVEVLRRFGMRPLPGVRITLVTRDVLTPYSGMLPGLVAGRYRHAEAHVDLGPLCRFARARLIHATVTGIDLESRTLACGSRPPVPFDLLSLDIGSTPPVDALPGADAHALPVKPVDRFIEGLESIDRQAIESGGRVHVAVIGGGAGGVELALAFRQRLESRLRERGLASEAARVSLLTQDPEVLSGHPRAARRLAAAALERRGVEVRTGRAAVALHAGAVELAGGERIACDAMVLATGARPAAWLADTGLALDQRGFVRVDPALRSVSHPCVYAAGDVASIDGHALPRSGVYAVRQGPALAENLRRHCTGEAPEPFRPQRSVLALVSTGDGRAIASRGSLAIEGAWLWRLKDRIDRRWMRRYAEELPAMAAGDDEPDAMRCGGCGAKVPAAVLRGALGRLAPGTGHGVLVGLDSADDAAVLEPPGPGEVTVQSVDHFRAFTDDAFLLGRVAATHCLGDLHAMGARPETAQALVTLAYGPPRRLEDELHALLAGATRVLGEAGATLVGGHTAEGPETSFGLVVNGRARADRLLRKGGLRAGDRLVLAKPLGTGVVLAAAMRGRAPAEALAAAYASMLLSAGAAAEVIARHGARACTDVTGFGLLGHLLEMLAASGTAACLDPAAIPLLPHARDLRAAGVASTLEPANAAFLASIVAPDDLADPTLRLLVDPQTSGGLLAGVPPARADACLRALRRAGYLQAAIVGEVRAPGVGAEPGTVRLAPVEPVPAAPALAAESGD